MNFPYTNIVILTGAGISAESGIQTFRAQDGLWEDHRIEDVATPEGFERDPELVQKFYNQRRAKLQEDWVKPNPAHLALGRLEKELKGRVTIITQNIDNLHERAGNKNIIHMHGELLKARCSGSNQTVEEFHRQRVAFHADKIRQMLGKEKQIRLVNHTVRSGENVWTIARQGNNFPVNLLLYFND